MNRRGILAALLCTPALLQSRQQTDKRAVVELDDDFVLEVRYGKDVIKFGAKDIWAELHPSKPSMFLFSASRGQMHNESEQ